MSNTNETSKVKPMTNTKQQKQTKLIEPAISDEISAAIASKIIATTPAPEVAARIKTRLMQRVQADSHAFVFANQGEWKAVSAGVEIKLLHKTADAKSFLIKMAANTSIDGHAHSQNEESFVLDGEVWLEGILCQTGDYHYAQAGSQHQKIHTKQGCTLLVTSHS